MAEYVKIFSSLIYLITIRLNTLNFLKRIFMRLNLSILNMIASGNSHRHVITSHLYQKQQKNRFTSSKYILQK